MISGFNNFLKHHNNVDDKEEEEDRKKSRSLIRKFRALFSNTWHFLLLRSKLHNGYCD